MDTNEDQMKQTDAPVIGFVAPATETDAPAKAESDRPMYDADVDQVIRFHTEKKGRLYPVAHVFASSALKDEAILDLERQRNQRISDAEVSEADDASAMAITSQGYQAALTFSEKHCVRVEGYAGKSGQKDNAYAVGLLFAVQFEELPLAAADELCPEDDGEQSTYRMRCLNHLGEAITVVHILRPANSDELSEAELLRSRTLLVQGTQFGKRDQRIPSTAKRWAELYDLMQVDTEGYYRKVPLHHKKAVAERHLKNEQKAITGE